MSRRGPNLPSVAQISGMIETEARALGIENLRAETLRGLATHLRLLYVWNARVNLTAIRDLREGLRRHTLESLEALPYVPAEGILADLGSGNGYPALPCLLARERLEGRLCESVARKVDFLRAAIRETGLAARVETWQGRLDAPDSLPAGASVATMRGFPSPGTWAFRLFELPGLERVLAWVSAEDALEIASRAGAASLVAEVVPLRSHPSGALLLLRRA